MHFAINRSWSTWRVLETYLVEMTDQNRGQRQLFVARRDQSFVGERENFEDLDD